MSNLLLYYLGFVLLVLVVLDTFLLGAGLIAQLAGPAPHPPTPGTVVRQNDSIANALILFLPWVFLFGLYALGFWIIRHRRTLANPGGGPLTSSTPNP